MDFVFALVTDIHFGPEAHFAGKLRKLTAQAPALAKAFVERMNTEVKPAMVVNLGDDIEDENPEADRERYKACVDILRGVNAELVHVAGNHDLIHLQPPDLLEIWGNQGSRTLYSAFDRAGIRFIVLHTVERKDLDVSVGDVQLRWLEEELKRAADVPVIVLMHHSAADQDLRGNRWFEGLPHICLVRERRSIRKLLAAHGRVLAVFNGHLHWNQITLMDGIPFVTLQSLIENVEDDAPGRAAAAHAVVRVQKKCLTVEIEGAERCRYQFEI